MFADVPFTKAKGAGNDRLDPNVVIERRMVALLGYPCDIYESGRLVKVQKIASVIDATKAGIPENWAGAVTYAPLPNLLSDATMFAVSLRTAANIDASYLLPENRIRSLTEYGWATFRQRMALCDTRAVIPVSALTKIGAATWTEIDFWQRWNEAGKDPHGFQPWLNQNDPNFSGYTRRSLLESGMSDQVEIAFARALL